MHHFLLYMLVTLVYECTLDNIKTSELSKRKIGSNTIESKGHSLFIIYLTGKNTPSRIIIIMRDLTKDDNNNHVIRTLPLH